MKPILFPAQIEGVSTRKDRTIRLTFGTQELSSDVMTTLFNFQNALCYVAVKPEDFGQDEIEQLEAHEAGFVDDNRKTKSQRLRAVLFVNWQNDRRGFNDFDAYYLAEMERIIAHYKAKLP